ncbi:hypothetical protein PVAP13_2KG098016 [Panicum virgatum]|uniref:Uncharacterized protein n=2 Tax=Panicum virgatum TaxID=38727 RepID=A0A8T0W3A2_PANVG|nr:hypothetical protein PVAP13_2KG098016 [Panicum virgatum]
MNPPLLKAVAGGRRRTERFKGCAEKKKGQHQCKVCKGYGHRWYKCREGDPEDIAALLAERPPKKKTKKTTMAATELSIVPLDDAAAPCMSFPPSQNSELSAKKKRKGRTSSSGKGKYVRSRRLSGSNQPEALSIEYPVVLSNSGQQTEKAPTKTRGKKRAAVKEKTEKVKKLKLDSPAMGTRSKTTYPSSPAMSTRSKRRLSL